MRSKGKIRTLLIGGVLLVSLIVIVSRLVLQHLRQSATSTWSELDQRAELLYNSGKLAEAEKVTQQALVFAQQSRWLDRAHVVVAYSNLATLYQVQGRYAEAEPLYRQAATIAAASLPADHPDKLIPTQGLGQLYYQQGRYAEAEPYCETALRLTEKILGPDHPKVAVALTFMAYLRMLQHRYDEAQAMLERALAIRVKTSGQGYEAGVTLQDLGSVLLQRGDREAALKLYERALEALTRSVGKAHYQTASVLYHLAEAYHEDVLETENPDERVSKARQALLYAEEALASRRQVLGPAHPEVAEALNMVAIIQTELGRYSEAESLHKEALEILNQSLGSTHYKSASTLMFLGGIYRLQKRYAEAEELCKEALDAAETSLGSDHEYLAAFNEELAKVYAEQERYDEADRFYKQALEIAEKTEGVVHPVYLKLRERYATFQAARNLTVPTPNDPGHPATLQDQ